MFSEPLSLILLTSVVAQFILFTRTAYYEINIARGLQFFVPKPSPVSNAIPPIFDLDAVGALLFRQE
jgi:hypothetical protein